MLVANIELHNTAPTTEPTASTPPSTATTTGTPTTPTTDVTPSVGPTDPSKYNHCRIHGVYSMWTN